MTQTQTPLAPPINEHQTKAVPTGYGKTNNRLSPAEKQHILVVALDIIWLNVSFVFATFIMGSASILSNMPLKSILFMLALINGMWVIVASYTDIHPLFEGIKLDLKIRDLFIGTLIYFGAISLIYYHFLFPTIQIHLLFPAFISFLLLSVITHFIIRFHAHTRDGTLSYAIIGGKASHLRDLRDTFSNVYDIHTKLIGQFSNRKINGIDRLGGFEDISPYLSNKPRIDKLLYIQSDLTDRQVQLVALLCRNQQIDFEVIPFVFRKGVQLEQLAHLPIIRRKQEPLRHLKNRILKRVFDITFSTFVIITVFPWLYPIIALLIKLDSPGPVLFGQKRTGYWNKSFDLYKFRSMAVNAKSDQDQAVKGDKRITKIGAFLRRTSLDELPQFFNVLKGEMSIVGPRPHMLKHTEAYSNLIDTFMIRHEVKPGITGWAQVSGWRGPTDQIYKMAKRVEFDVNYIENWNFWFDCKCVLLTVINMIKGETVAF